MRESDTYQAILEEGRGEGLLEGVLRSLLLIATPRLGEPSEEVRRRLESETDLSRLEEWLRCANQIESWSELPGFGR